MHLITLINWATEITTPNAFKAKLDKHLKVKNVQAQQLTTGLGTN